MTPSTPVISPLGGHNKDNIEPLVRKNTQHLDLDTVAHMFKAMLTVTELLIRHPKCPPNRGAKGSGVECIRGSGAHDSLVYKTDIILAFAVVPIIVSSSLFAIHKSVSERETRSSSYGSASLNLPSRIQRTGRRQNNRLTLARRSLYKLLAFSGAWFFTHIIYIIVVCMKRFADVLAPRPPVYLVMTFLYPLQGHFNFLVFIHLTVLNIKRSRNNYSWYEAFMRAVRSKLNMSLPAESRRRDLNFSIANTRQFEVCEPTNSVTTSPNQNTEFEAI